MQNEIKVTEIFLIRIEYEKPKGVVYRNIRAIEYPNFLNIYPKEALLKGLIISEIKVIKKYQSYED